MTDVTDAENMTQLRERVAGLLEQVGRLKEEASAARSELNASYEGRNQNIDRLISKMEKRQMESERSRKALREDVEKAIAALVAAL